MMPARGAAFVLFVVLAGAVMRSIAIAGTAYGTAVIVPESRQITADAHITYGAEITPLPSSMRSSDIQTEASANPKATARHSLRGSRRKFWVHSFDPTLKSQSIRYNQISATLEFSTSHVDYWIEDAIPKSFVELNQAAIGASGENAYDVAIENFGALTYNERDVEMHGTVVGCDRMNQPTKNIPSFIPSSGELANMLIVSPERAPVAYVDQQSYHYQAELNCRSLDKSNEMPALFIWPIEEREKGELQDGVLPKVTAEVVNVF